jgi:hypothetical protein
MYSIGMFFDEITDQDNKVIETNKRFNRFVFSAGKAYNFILKNYFVSGVRQPLSIVNPDVIDRAIPLVPPQFGQIYHAFGEGNPSWDTNPEDAQWYESELTNEIYRKVPDYINYIKYGFGTASSGTMDEIIDVRRFEGQTLVGRTEEDDYFNGQTITITAGTNVGEVRTIVAFEQQAGRILVNSPYPAPIDITSSYEITPVTTLSASNYIEIRTTLPNGLASDPFNDKEIREHGLVLGNENILMTKANHPKVYKSTTNQIARVYRINNRF